LLEALAVSVSSLKRWRHRHRCGDVLVTNGAATIVPVKASGHCTAPKRSETNRIFGGWHLLERAPSNAVDSGLMIFVYDNRKFKVWQRTAYRGFVQLLTTADSVLKSSVFFWAQINTLILNASVFVFEGELTASLKAQNYQFAVTPPPPPPHSEGYADLRSDI
jgi:hypothetical protein